MFSAEFNPAQAEKLFAGTGHTFAEMLALADAQKPLPRFDMKKRYDGDGGNAEGCGGFAGIWWRTGRIRRQGICWCRRISIIWV